MTLNAPIEKYLLTYLKVADIIAPNSKKAHEVLNKSFPKVKHTNEKCIKLLISELETNPQHIVDLSRQSLLDIKDITTYFTNKDLQPESPSTYIKQLNTIALFYEIPGIFKLAAYLLSEGKAPIYSLNGPQNIYTHFKNLNIKFDVDQIRKIRNAIDHRYSFDNDWLLDKKGKKVATLLEIQILHKKFVFILKWWKAFLFTNLFCLPKFAASTLLFCLFEIDNNFDEYKRAYNGLQKFAPHLFERKKKILNTLQKEPVTLIEKVKTKVGVVLGKWISSNLDLKIQISQNKKEVPEQYNSDLGKIESNLKRQFEQLRIHLKRMRINLINGHDINNLQDTLNWLDEIEISLIEKIHNQKAT